MRIVSIHIKNFKAFRDTLIKDLPKMCVFVGPNGSGKSSFFDVFGFLSDCLQQNVTAAINVRGGFREVISRGADPNTGKIWFEIKFRNDRDAKSPLITYLLEIGQESGRIIVEKEHLKYRRGQTGKPWYFLKFERGEGIAITNESEYGQKGKDEKRTAQKTASKDILAIKGLGQFEEFKAISSFRNLLEKWYISNFKIDNGRSISDTGFSSHLSITGDNLAQVTKFLFENHRPVFDNILAKLPKRIPGIDQVEAKETEDGRIILRFAERSFRDPFVARYVSDGTIKMFAYMILLNDPEPHPLLCIEEPENYLHPEILLQLSEEIREYADRGGQVFVSTHSPDFVNGVEVGELFFMVKKGGFTEIRSAASDPLVVDLAKENKLGWLWRGHYIKGANLNDSI